MAHPCGNTGWRAGRWAIRPLSRSRVIVPIQGVTDGRSGELIEKPAIRTYDLADGTRGWSVRPPKRANAIAVDDGTVVILSGGWDGTGVVLGYSLAEGTERWRTKTPGDFSRGPVVVDGTGYFGSSEQYVRALSVQDGREAWRRSFGTRPAGLAADDDSVYVGVGGSLHAVTPGDGRDVWSITRGDGRSIYFTTPAVGEGVVYAGTVGVDAPLYALDASDGRVRWSHQFPNTVVEGDIVRSGIEAQPAVVEGAVYAYAADGLYAFGEAG